MAETVSKLAAFVFAHGEMASEILFRDIDEDGEVPGVLPEEREVMERVEPMLRATWIGILSACREAVWKRAAGHPTELTLRTSKTQPNKMFENDAVKMPLVDNGCAWCGVELAAWGEPTYNLYVWVWTSPRFRPEAEAAVRGLLPGMWRNEKESFLITLDAPHQGDAYQDVGERVAEVLWTLARPIADAVLAKRSTG
jgi:hypothetical protein